MTAKAADAALPGPVVVTRDVADATALQAALGPGGPAVVAVALTATVPVDGPEQAALVAALAEPYAWLVVTSARASAAVLAAAATLGPPAQVLRAGRVAAVGARSAAPLRDVGLEVMVPADATGRALAAAVPGDLAGCRVLWPRAAAAQRDLADGLRTRGAVLDELVAYRTVPVDLTAAARATLAAAAVIVVYAPSQVAALRAAEPPPRPLVAVGPTTAAAARAAGLVVRAVAAAPTPAAVAAAVATVYAARHELP